MAGSGAGAIIHTPSGTAARLQLWQQGWNIWNITSPASGPYFQIDENGTSRLFFQNGGNVGIGNTAPGSLLTVGGTASVNGTSIASNGALSLSNSQTTITPSGGSFAGTYICSQPFQGSSYKKVIIYFSGWTAGTTNPTYTFPTAFTHTPAMVTCTSGGVAPTATINTTSYTATAGSTLTGFVILEGF